MRSTLKKVAKDFKLFEAGIGGAGEGPTNTNVPNAADEQQVIDKLDRSVKFDEIDSVTFGLETDDGKIVKVYVNAEQAESFEKALSAKLGEVDDIEEVLNDLAKEFEIIDVEWPEGGGDEESDEEEEENDGSNVLDKKVYGPDNKPGTVEDNFDRNFSSSESTSESLSYGEEATLSLLESAASIESRFSTATQLMVYHAIIDLGIPEIALARNPYRAAIIKGIKEAAAEIQQNGQMKIALKNFIRRSFDYEKATERDEKAAEKKTNDSEQKSDVSNDSKDVKESRVLGKGMTSVARAADVEQSDREYIAQRQKKQKIKDLEEKIKSLKSNHASKQQIVQAETELKKLKEEKDMKINVTEDKMNWEFKGEDGVFTISSKQISMELDDEETEKLIKGMNNRNVTVVRDHTQSPPKKFVFSPRGSSVLVKAVGSEDGFMMNSKDVQELIGSAVPEKEEVKEAINEALETWAIPMAEILMKAVPSLKNKLGVSDMGSEDGVYLPISRASVIEEAFKEAEFDVIEKPTNFFVIHSKNTKKRGITIECRKTEVEEPNKCIVRWYTE